MAPIDDSQAVKEARKIAKNATETELRNLLARSKGVFYKTFLEEFNARRKTSTGDQLAELKKLVRGA
jgi:hypothetical protein